VLEIVFVSILSVAKAQTRHSWDLEQHSGYEAVCLKDAYP